MSYSNPAYNPEQAEKLVGKSFEDETGFVYDIVDVEHNQDEPFTSPQYKLEQDILGEKSRAVSSVVKGIQNGDYEFVDN